MWSVPMRRLNDYLNNLKPIPHIHGRSIIMPSGSGKSYWMEHLQHGRHFIDSDPLMIHVGAMPPLKGKDFSGGLTWANDMETICRRCDQVMVECKKRGLWIMGATWWDITLVDAFVVLPAELNKKYLEGKKAKGEGFRDRYYEEEVVPYIEGTIKPEAKKHGKPIFDSIEWCARYIMQLDQKPLKF